jgi:hypothetical protein
MFSNFPEFMVPAVLQSHTGSTNSASGDISLTFADDSPVQILTPEVASKRTQKYQGKNVIEHMITYIGFESKTGDRIVWNSKTWEVEISEDWLHSDANYMELNLYRV